MTVNRLVLEWEEKIKLHLEREMQFNQWRSKNFKGMHPTLIATKKEEEDEGEVTLYLMRRSLEVLRKFHWMILGGRFNQLSHVRIRIKRFCKPLEENAFRPVLHYYDGPTLRLELSDAIAAVRNATRAAPHSASNCSLPHHVNKIKAMVHKQIEEDKVRQLAIMNLAVEFENAIIAKDDMRKEYEECNDISKEKRALIDTFLKEESDKDYEMHNALFRNAAKLEKQINNKVVWMHLENK
ncbi:hypothetical protein Tco_0988593 [Tanacetum coccineum]|uniref:Uncharacterized protein n=1 Tax=Tanacetum coccineum TaxID=301880 RepID=A0ABQ5ERC0_9ASTR